MLCAGASGASFPPSGLVRTADMLRDHLLWSAPSRAWMRQLRPRASAAAVINERFHTRAERAVCSVFYPMPFVP